MAFTPNVSVFIDGIVKLSDAERVAFSEIIFTELYETSEISQYHNIISGVRGNTPIPIMDRTVDWEYMKDASGLTSNCDDLPCDVGVVNSLLTWNPAFYKCSLEFCSKDLSVIMLDYFNSAKLKEGFDENTFYVSFMKELIGRNLKNSLWTKTYFAATTATSNALTGHNGLFVQYDAATTGTARRVAIAKNGGASYAAQKLTNQEGFDIVNSVNEAVEGDLELGPRNDVEIRVTRSIASAYLGWLRAEKQVSCCERDPLTGIYTLENLGIFGRPIKVVKEWDAIINSIGDFNTGTAHVNPHRAVATYKASSPIGTADATQLERLDLKYDSYNDKAKFVSEYTFDTKLVRDNHVVLAM